MKEFSHTDKSGKASMVDVSSKPDQLRTATAKGFISLSEDTVRLIRDNEMKKGDVLTVAQVAGIQGGKNTSLLIPLCHPLQISKIDVKTEILTIYDMCKAVDKNMVISEISLVEKTKQ